jgi:C-terminal processing protease CtpA/Prc
MKHLFTLLAVLFSLAATSQTILKKEALQEDFSILRKSYETLHPGLYKYQDKATIDAYFEVCKTALNKDQTLQEAYLNISRLIAQFKCGHSYANFSNQEDAVITELFEKKVCLPVHFKIIENRILITKSADSAVKTGVELTKINGVKVGTILNKLKPLVRADGSNDAKRLYLLQVGDENEEYFDIFYPMLFPLKKEQLDLTFYDFQTKKTYTTTVATMQHKERNAIIKQKYQIKNLEKVAFSWLNEKTALLQLNTFANYRNPINFDKVYAEIINTYKEKKGEHLIIDLRNNEGGDTENGYKLISYFIDQPIAIPNINNRWAFTMADSGLAKYVSNQWARQWVYKKPIYFEQLANGQYIGKKDPKFDSIKPNKNNFKTNIYVLMGANNSSATYLFIDVLKNNKVATTIGQTSGGNQKGITASALFFMLLPNSKIEFDVPLIGMDYTIAKTRPDSGIVPDVVVKKNIMDVVNGVDTEMEALKKLLAK